jgi:hypothetical protein
MGPNVQLLVRRVPGSTHASPTPGEKVSWENLREFFRFRKRRICFGEAIKVFPILGPSQPSVLSINISDQSALVVY